MLTEPIAVGCINEARGGSRRNEKCARPLAIAVKKNTGKVPQTGVL